MPPGLDTRSFRSWCISSLEEWFLSVLTIADNADMMIYDSGALYGFKDITWVDSHETVGFLKAQSKKTARGGVLIVLDGQNLVC